MVLMLTVSDPYQRHHRAIKISGIIAECRSVITEQNIIEQEIIRCGQCKVPFIIEADCRSYKSHIIR